MDYESELKANLNNMWRCAIFLMKNDADASEVFQNTIVSVLKFFKKNPQFKPQNFKKWLIAILFNEAKKIFNSRYKNMNIEEMEEELPDIEESSILSHFSVDVGSIFENFKDNFTTAVKNALERLDPIQREILLAVEVLNYTYKEVAEILCLPIGTVMSKLDRARKKIRFLLSDSLRKYHKYVE